MKLTSIERMLALSISFTFALVAFRIVYSGTLTYVFFTWNLFLATLPMMFSRRLNQRKKVDNAAVLLIIGWLLFLPNAPYVVTDIFHFKERYPVPKWYDLLIVTSAAWNGLCLGFISLMQVEQFLLRTVRQGKTQLLIFSFIFLCGYGIYIGRYLRFNSWDLVSAPGRLLSETIQHFVDPVTHFRVWEFTLLFSVMLSIIYYTLKHLPLPQRRNLDIAE